MIRRMLLGLAVLMTGLLIAWIVLWQPGRSFAMRRCPACFGYSHLGDGIYVSNAAMAASARLIVREARGRVQNWYGAPQSVPVFFICGGGPCARRSVVVRSSALGFSDSAGNILLLPGGNNPVIAAHEWSHAEFKRRLGLWDFTRAEVPAWFDEGLAVLVAGDRRYLAPDVTAKFCPLQPSAAGLPVTEQAWGPRAGRDHMLYARSACVVARWLAGPDHGVLGLIDRIKAGDSFAQAFAR